MSGATNIAVDRSSGESLARARRVERRDDVRSSVRENSRRQNKRLALLAAGMVAVIVAAAGASLAMLYRAEVDRQSELLHELALSEARLIKSVIAAGAEYQDPLAITPGNLAILTDSLSRRLPKAGFGKSGEFILARRDGDQIILYRRGEPFSPGPTLAIPMQSDLAVPARLGLKGRSGIIRVLDYAGVKVLAAHEPVPGFELAVVAKINLAEVKGPFLIAAVVISAGIAVFLTLVFGGWYYINLSMRHRERTAWELRRSQSRLSRAQRIARLGGWQYNFRSKEFSATEETYRMFGVSRAEVMDAPKATSEFLHPDDLSATREARALSLENSSDYEIDYRIVRPDDEVRYIREQGAFDFDKQGVRIRLSGTVHDVTAGRRTEERLRQQALIFDQIHDAVVFTDTSGKIMSWNKGAERQSGFSAAQMIGSSVDICVAQRDKARFWKELAPKAYKEGSAEFDVWLRHRDGRHYRGHTSVAIVRDTQGEIIGAVSCTLDITEKFSADQELIQAKRLAENANRSKSEFLANMSHELRTPLNAILGFSQIMMSGMLAKDDLDRVHEYAKDIFDSGTHLLDVINDLLDLAKIEAGHMDLEEGVVDIDDIITTSLRQISGPAQKRSIKLTQSVQTDMPLLWADDRKLKQVILNLLSNAVKFTPKGGKVEVTAGLQDNGQMELTVRDTGQGMTEAEIELSLQPFGQASDAMTRDHEGTGLGLPLSRSLCELHGGDLQIESTKGVGTTVKVHLPDFRIRNGADGTLAAD
ncbi:MAG: PAS domain S-box protein [Rhodospirillaceae bacterium]|nr:PAS domain S-box protein [Rhodospirillaceae bacterium]MBT6427799.1 PAS domain S-box protein [Rhodospirillaceae bacterium]